MKTPTSTDSLSPVSGGDGAAQAASRASEAGRKAVDAIDDKRDGVARGIDTAASTLRGSADSLPGGDSVARAAHTAAGAMEKTADYVRDRDIRGMLSDIGQIVVRHPGAALIGAAALGFLLARSLSRH